MVLNVLGLNSPREREHMKIFAESINRWRATVAEKQLYGGATVTEFLVGVEGSHSSTWQKIIGYGSTPGERKTYAIKQFNKGQEGT